MDRFITENGVLISYRGNNPDVTVPDGITEIGEMAFFFRSTLKHVTLPAGLKTIGEGAFSNCVNLTGVSLPEGLKTISRNAFFYCKKLTDIALPEGLDAIGEGAFGCCTGLTGINLPDSLLRIGSKAFHDCANLTGISLPDGLLFLGHQAFGNCASLTGITLPEELMFLGTGVFNGCSSINYFKCLNRQAGKLCRSTRITAYKTFMKHQSDYREEERLKYIRHIKTRPMRAELADSIVTSDDVEALINFLRIFAGSRVNIAEELLALTEKYQKPHLNAYILEAANPGFSSSDLRL